MVSLSLRDFFSHPLLIPSLFVFISLNQKFKMEVKARKPSAVKHPVGVNKITEEPLAPVLMYTVVVLLLVFNHIM